MSLPVAIVLGIIFVPIYAYFWSFIFKWENNRRVKRNNFDPMSKKAFYFLLFVHAICAIVMVITAIYISYFS
ncbi:hypothetical protein HYE69_05490 [Staphylococcus sp. GSSP0090]|nr:hypothetical protein [Staphylococcus sp. GSSP0090]